MDGQDEQDKGMMSDERGVMNEEIQAAFNSSFITPHSSINSYPVHPVHLCEFA
jgi:hypothetical protein